MDLFGTQIHQDENRLPQDGTVLYYGPVMTQHEAGSYFDALMKKISWRNDEAVIYGKHYVTKRKVAWYGDKSFSYTYSNTTREALPWTPELLALRELSESITGERFNSCLLNLYHDGDEGMAWHSDDEKALGKNAAIASLSLGAERRFLFRHKETKETVELFLQDGSLLLMKDETQSFWRHSLPKSKKITKPRINLTFRTMIDLLL